MVMTALIAAVIRQRPCAELFPVSVDHTMFVEGIVMVSSFQQFDVVTIYPSGITQKTLVDFVPVLLIANEGDEIGGQLGIGHCQIPAC